MLLAQLLQTVGYPDQPEARSLDWVTDHAPTKELLKDVARIVTRRNLVTKEEAEWASTEDQSKW